MEQFTWISEYCESKPLVTAEFPFDETTMVWKVAGKMFCLGDIETFEKHINAINAAENEQDLFKAYKDGIKATANDPISQKRIIAVKDERKKALGVE